MVALSSTIGFNPDSVTAMYPVIQESDRVWSDRITYPRWRNPQRYQVITFGTDRLNVQFPNQLATRRIVALPGETLEIRQGQMMLNGNPVTDERITLPSDFNLTPITLDSEEYYAIGDNPDYPHGETFGTVVPRRNIQGQIVLRISPLDRFGWIP